MTPIATKPLGVHLAYMPHIDGLRAVGVMAVVFYHAGILGARPGHVGVDIFFAISGFLISRTILQDFKVARHCAFSRGLCALAEKGKLKR